MTEDLLLLQIDHEGVLQWSQDVDADIHEGHYSSDEEDVLLDVDVELGSETHEMLW